jgi:hypothetical protein
MKRKGAWEELQYFQMVITLVLPRYVPDIVRALLEEGGRITGWTPVGIQSPVCRLPGTHALQNNHCLRRNCTIIKEYETAARVYSQVFF